MNMKKTISPLIKIGLLINTAIIIIERFVTPISNWIAMPLLIAGIVLVIMGGLEDKKEKQK